MNRMKLNHYYPHILLLTGASLCLILALSGPMQTFLRPAQSGQQASASGQSLPLFDDDAYSLTYASNLSDLLREARRKVMRMRMLRKANQAEETHQDQEADPESDEPQRRMVRRFDQRNMLDVDRFEPVVHEDYALVSDPLVWRRPDVLPPQSEYTVLEYGEIGSEQLDETELLEEPEQAFRALVLSTNEEADDTPAPGASGSASSGGSSTQTPVATVDLAVPVQASRPERSVPAQSAVAQPGAPIAGTLPAPNAQALLHAAPQSAVSLSLDTPTAATPQAPSAQPATPSVPASTAAKPPSHSDDSTTAVLPGRSGLTPSAAPAPLVNLPTQAVNKKAQDKLDDTPAIDNLATPAPPALANKPANQTMPDTAKNNQTKPLVVFVDDYKALGDDKLIAISRAINEVNRGANAPVFEMTTDPSLAHDIVFRQDNSGDMGNKLGTTQIAYLEDEFGNQTYLKPGANPAFAAPVITLNNEFNWYTGEDAHGIDDDEFDYQTTVIHEFLHVGGLDDDFDNQQAVSFAGLAPGETRRILDDHEQQALAKLAETGNLEQTLPEAAANGKGVNVRYKTQALTAAVPEPVSAVVIAMGVLFGITLRRR